MKITRLKRIGLLGVSIGFLLIAGGPMFVYGGSVKEFLIVTGEWKWKAKPGEAPVADRVRGDVKLIERYVFDPAFLVVNKGDTVVMRIHVIKGSKHIVEIKAFGVPETQIKRGEEKTIKFVADKAGTFKFVCTNHVDHNKEGPMEGYIYVIDR